MSPGRIRRHPGKRTLVFVAVLWTAAGARAAVPAAPAPVLIDTLTVTAPRPERHLGGPATVTVVDLDDDGARTDLAELLEEVAGLQIRRYGGLGAPALPSVRGSTATQVTVLIDGVPVSDALTGQLDLSTLPLDRFTRAEVFRGAAPASLGAGGGLGAVNLISREPGRGAGELQLSAGSWGEAGARLVTQGRAAGVDALLLLHGRRADNAYPFPDDRWTPYNPADDTVGDRVNDWFREGGASLVLRRNAWDGPRVRLAAGLYDRAAGRPGPTGDHASPHATTSTGRADLHLELSDAARRYGLEAAWRHDRDHLDDPLAEVAWPAGETVGDSRHGLLRAFGALDHALPAGLGTAAWLVTAGARRQVYDRTTRGLEQPARERTAWEAGADLRWDLPGARLTVWPGLRWRRLRDDFPAETALPGPVEPAPADPRVREDWAPSAALVWEARPGVLFVEARRFREHRAPTWAELFGIPGGLAGNRGLTPERLDGRELALRLHGRGLRVRWAWFRNDVQDAIVWYPNSQATSRASNIGRTRTIGHELELAADLGSHASGWLSLTQQEARDVGIDPVYAGKDLPHQPRWTVAVGGVVRRDGWALRGRLLAEAGHWRDRYNGPGARVLARTLTSLALTRAWDHARLLQDRELRLTLEILNLTDTAARDLDGYPLPGRSLRATALIR